MKIDIRDEMPGDATAVSGLITQAFAGRPYSAGTEAAIVDALRRDGALTLSLLAVAKDAPVGHIAFSPVVMANGAQWLGLGPLSVLPDHQGKGIGSSLVRAALSRLDPTAKGYVLAGDPAYYNRFGFRAGGATFPGVPDHFVLTRALRGPTPRGPVTYHTAFTT
jgi:putative acetyltransferase